MNIKRYIDYVRQVSCRIYDVVLLYFLSNGKKIINNRYIPFVEKEKLRVIFILSFATEWDCFSKIFKIISNLDYVNASVISDDYPRNKHTVFDFLRHEGVNPIRISEYAVRKERPHVIFLADEITTKRNLWIFTSFARVVYIPYGSSISDAKYSKQQQYNLPIHNIAWRVFVAGDFARKLYKKYCDSGDKHVIALGHPKTEVLSEWRGRFYLPRKFISRKKYHVFLWNINFRDVLWSTWNEYGEYILNIFSQRDDVRLICRPHPFFFDSFSTQQESDEIRSLIVNNKNTILDEDSSMKNAFMLSDAMLTDGSSIIYDYLPLKKPMLYLRTPMSELMHSHAYDLIRKFHYVGSSISTINLFVDAVCDGTDSLREKRKKILEYTEINDPIGVSSNICDHILSEFSE